MFLDLYQKTRLLELKNEELDAFAATAAHDLKAPLRHAGWLCRYVVETYADRLDDEIMENLDEIATSMWRMTDLVEDLLEYARAGNIEGKLEPFRLGEIAERVVSSLEGELKASGGRVELGELPTALGHESGFTQILQNLIANAIKYRGDKPPVVEVSASSQDDMWLMTVKDNGIGIAPKHHKRIFAAFKRLHSNSEYAGTGLGLATCAKVVERFGGRIWVESELGKGATFHVTLPKAKAESTSSSRSDDAPEKPACLTAA